MSSQAVQPARIPRNWKLTATAAVRVFEHIIVVVTTICHTLLLIEFRTPLPLILGPAGTQSQASDKLLRQSVSVRLDRKTLKLEQEVKTRWGEYVESHS